MKLSLYRVAVCAEVVASSKEDAEETVRSRFGSIRALTVNEIKGTPVKASKRERKAFNAATPTTTE